MIFSLCVNSFLTCLLFFSPKSETGVSVNVLLTRGGSYEELPSPAAVYFWDDMKCCLGLFLLLCCGVLHLGSGLSCYKCSDYTGRCSNVQDCTYEDSCISLSERDGKTIRQCIRYTDCDNSRLSQMFPSISSFNYRCCSSNLCNSGSTVTTATSVLALAGSLLGVWWCWV